MRFALRRLGFFALTIWAALTLNFFLPRVMPGNPAIAMLAKFRGPIPPTALKALEGDATDPDYHFNVGYALWKQGDYTQAAESFRAVLDRNPEDSEAVLFLGRCLKSDGQRVRDPKSEGRERLKLNFEEMAYRQLKAELDPKH